MWKQYNKLCTVNTADMDTKELVTHREALRLIKNDLNFTTQNIYVLYFKLVCIVILISMCHNLN
jgi:hypothetical protein